MFCSFRKENLLISILTDDIFKCIFLNEHDRISIQISLKFVPGSPIYNKAQRRTGEEPYLNRCWPDSQMHICGTRGDELIDGDAGARDHILWRTAD